MNWRMICGLSMTTSVVLGVQLAESGFAAGTPWDEPTTLVSSGFLSPEDGWISADGRYVAMTNSYDYRPRVSDRADGVLIDPLLPISQSVAIVPDGSSLIVITNRDLVSGTLGPIQQIYRHPLGAGGVNCSRGLSMRLFSGASMT